MHIQSNYQRQVHFQPLSTRKSEHVSHIIPITILTTLTKYNQSIIQPIVLNTVLVGQPDPLYRVTDWNQVRSKESDWVAANPVLCL